MNPQWLALTIICTSLSMSFWNSGIAASGFLAQATTITGESFDVLSYVDLLAARKVNGFAAIGHTQMCAICHCTRQQQDDLNDSFTSLGK